VTASPKVALVVTTIYELGFLEGYLTNIRRFGREAQTRIIVIVDRKTPRTVAESCHTACGLGFDVVCPSLDEQTAFLQRLGVDPGWIPFDSDNRRNVGFLMALAKDVDIVVSLDDDNYCPAEEDFVGAHSAADSTTTTDVRESSDGWINICEELRFREGAVPFPRGFPYGARRAPRTVETGRQEVRLAANVGLWVEDPDVDAATRLTQAPWALAYEGTPFAAGAATWSPINTQNTAVKRAAMAAYYYVRMGHQVEGLRIDRYGDVLSGFLLQKCVHHLGETVRIGRPVCRHLRTPHNLFQDLYYELAGMVILEDLLPRLRELEVSGAQYAEAYASLAAGIRNCAHGFKGFVWDSGGREFLLQTADNMETWLSALRALG
jgi:Reversibly glycosylated polypeptide